jgi:hypothetical protein
MKNIKTYNNYIKENLTDEKLEDREFMDEMMKFFKDKYNFPTNIEPVDVDTNAIELYNNTLEEEDVHPMSVGYIVRVEYYNYIYLVQTENNDEEEFDNIEDVKNYLDDYLDNYSDDYYEYLVYCSEEINKIPVFDTDKYSEYILNYIKDKKFNKNLKNVFQYLNKETQDKLEHLVNATNFDLI